MTEGSNASGRAHARPGMIELTFLHADLAAAIARIGLVTRLSASEHDFMLRQGEAGRDAVCDRWCQVNLLLQEAMAEVEQAHARLDATARHVFQAIGDAEERDEASEAERT